MKDYLRKKFSKNLINNQAKVEKITKAYIIQGNLKKDEASFTELCIENDVQPCEELYQVFLKEMSLC